MPRNGQGIYSAPPGSTAIPNQTISSSQHNSLVADLVQDANTARPVVAGGTGSTTADAAAKNLGLVSAKDLAGTGAVGGTANAITLATARVYTALADTVYLSFKATADIAAGGTTLNLDGLGAKKIRKVVDAGDVDVNVGDIITGGIYTLRYDIAADSSAGAFILLNGSNNDPYSVGDFFDSARTLSSDWLRRDGALYDAADYPELADVLPALPDGILWDNFASGSTDTTAAIIHDGERFLALTQTNGNILESDDGETWSALANVGDTGMQDFAFGNGFYVAIKQLNGKVYTSPDAQVWSLATTVSGAPALLSVAFGDGKFVIVGETGKILTTTDGVTFTPQTSGVTDILWGVYYSGTTWIAVGEGGKLLTSTDAATWTPRTSGVTTTLRGAYYHDGLYIVVGSLGVILTSTNLTGWTSRTSGTISQLNNIVGNDIGWLVVGKSGASRMSTDGTTWSSTATGFATDLNDVIIDPDNERRYLVVGPASNILEGLRTAPTQFRVPSDDPDYGWIKAVS